ncbi:hypothetical protein Pelo_4423 [Pelomyxa schiedti]|nr:hypothetical protein Pelo_4423 [Pelomyxa schiedti]
MQVPTVSDECIDAFKTPNTLGVIFRVSSSSDDNVKRVSVKFMTPMVLSSLRLTCAGHNQHGFHHHAGTAEGLNVTDLVERVSRFERDPIDQASVTAFVNGTPSFTS